MRLRHGLERHWVGAKTYVARKHAGGLVVTGPEPLSEALKRQTEIKKDGHEAVIVSGERYPAVWLKALVDLTEDN